ncbi:putative beta-lysine N-acetyltransferase [Ferrimonas sediminicola]|uniref:Putative beta-lysine N-acetyltransferase n=1 Tax=Ferrimonas sediminicola TaxID=2569538 RepID=A0A4U1BDL6_9GAMM|nr:putative beta-lysine N-acetyltransferase [Ferrimonas sediminicola]TKB48875.1 putative beta-lysine N-acetyltransferase [Ferrimonas sediminicola]
MSNLLASPPPQAPYDVLASLEGAQIQHGPNNNRIYLMELGKADPARLIDQMQDLAAEKGYGKIFAKVPEHRASQFLAKGFRLEARIPDFYPECDALFLGHYPDPRRALDGETHQLHRVLQLAKRNLAPVPSTAVDTGVRRCTPEDVRTMARLYRRVFPSYPFAIDDPDFLLDSMRDNVDYFCIEQQGRMLAVAAAEKAPHSLTAEMTDFATLPDAQGHGFAGRLLQQMERQISHQGYRLAYTIARAHSVGMNRTFARHRYLMAGRLTNNTQIGGRIETMNVWYKPLR